MKEDIRQMFMHVVHQQKDIDHDLKEELLQFDDEEFKMTACMKQISELQLARLNKSSESKQRPAKFLNMPLKDLIEEELNSSLEENFVSVVKPDY